MGLFKWRFGLKALWRLNAMDALPIGAVEVIARTGRIPVELVCLATKRWLKNFATHTPCNARTSTLTGPTILFRRHHGLKRVRVLRSGGLARPAKCQFRSALMALSRAHSDAGLYLACNDTNIVFNLIFWRNFPGKKPFAIACSRRPHTSCGEALLLGYSFVFQSHRTARDRIGSSSSA